MSKNDLNLEIMETYKKVDYIERVEHKLFNLRKAMSEMTNVWLKDSEFEIDLNEVITKEYPFTDSFDDMEAKMRVWILDAEKELLNLKRTLE
jgi:hypothetical protein